MMTPDILEMVNEVRRELIAEIEKSDETMENKKALIAIFNGMSSLELLRLRFPGYQQPVGKSPVNLEILNFFPPFTMRSPIRIEKGSNTGLKLLNEAVLQVIWKRRSGFYFIIYFVKASPNSFKACCCFSDLFNYLYGKDVCGYKVLPQFPKSIEKRFPNICEKLHAATFGSKSTLPYLNTIGFNGQPKQWFLMANINDIDEWTNLRLYGPASPLIQDVMNQMFQTVVALFDNIYASDDVQFISKAEEYLGFSFRMLGQK